MLNKLFKPKKEDICPNCGTGCFATDVICPNCGKNLDELFEQLPPELPKTKPIITIPREYKFLITWVLATSVGFALGELFLTPLAFTFVPFHLPMNGVDLSGFVLGIASGIATGISIGTFQWLVLRNYIPYSWWWIIATPLGMASGSIIQRLFVVMESLYLPINFSRNLAPIDFWASVFFYGIIIGVSQWIVLRQYGHKAWTWIIANGFVWAFATIIVEDFVRAIFYPTYFLNLVQGADNPYVEIVIYGAVGMSFGIMTGVLLLWLFNMIRKTA